MKAIRLAFIGLHNEKNLGDPIIARCTDALYREAIGEDYDIISSYPVLNYYCYHAQSRLTNIAWSIAKRLHLPPPI